MYENKRAYPDPTADEAISRVMREYKERQKKLYGKKKVYVVSPYAGDVKSNTEAAIKYCRYVISRGKIPVASHLLYPQILDEDNPEERELGKGFGMALMRSCDEVWIFGNDITPGMKDEIDEAHRLNKPFRYVKEVPND